MQVLLAFLTILFGGLISLIVERRQAKQHPQHH